MEVSGPPSGARTAPVSEAAKGPSTQKATSTTIQRSTGRVMVTLIHRASIPGNSGLDAGTGSLWQIPHG